MKHLLSLLLTLLLSAASAGTENLIFRSGSAVGLESVNRLRTFERYLAELFPLARFTPGKAVLELGPGGDEGFSSPGVRRVRLDPAALMRGELTELAEAASAILRARGRCRKNERVPLWICAGFRQHELACRTFARFLGGNRRFPAAEALLRAGGMPDPEKVIAALPAAGSPAENLWYDDHARLMGFILHRSGFKGTPEEAGPALKKLLAAGEFGDRAAEAVWTVLNFRSFELQEKEIEAMLKFPLPLLDKEGKPTGKHEAISLERFPRAVEKRPDREELCRTLADRLQKNLSPLLPPLRRKVRALRASALRLRQDPEESAAFLGALAELRRETAFLRARSAFLDAAAPPSPGRAWETAFEENSAPGTLLSPEARKALLETEARYAR